MYCYEARDSLFTAVNKYYPCVGSETFIRLGDTSKSPLTLSPYIKNDHKDFTLKTDIRTNKLTFKLTSPTGRTLSQAVRAPIRPFRNFFFTLYVSNKKMPSLRLIKDEQIVILSQRLETATNNPFTVHIDETELVARIKQHMNVLGNRVQGQLRQMLIPSKFTSKDFGGRTISADIIKIDCDLKTGTTINRNGQYTISLGYIIFSETKLIRL